MIPTDAHIDEIDACLAERFPDARVTRRPSPYATSHRIEEVAVQRGTATIEMLLKHVGERSLVAAARGTKPAPLDCAARELYALDELLPPLGLGTPRLYGSRPPAPGRDGWLLIERVAGIELWQSGELDTWEAAARWLAALHDAGRAIAPHGTPLARRDAAYLSSLPERARRTQADRRQAVRIDWLRERWPAIVERLSALPPTLLHGEFYASNVIVSGARVCPVDWELAAHGPGVLDLAALASGWDDAERARLVHAYAGATTAGGWWRDEAELAASLADARVCICMQWLGWAEDWRPPPAHRRDWLSEALATAQEHGL